MVFFAYRISISSIIILFSLILSWQDIKHLEVNLWIQWLSIFCALICQLIFARNNIWIFILSSMIMGIFYYIVRKITHNKLGSADIWFGFFQGLFLTPFFIPVCLVIEALAAFFIMKPKISRKAFPFIPFMSFGLIVSYVLQALTA